MGNNSSHRRSGSLAISTASFVFLIAVSEARVAAAREGAVGTEQPPQSDASEVARKMVATNQAAQNATATYRYVYRVNDARNNAQPTNDPAAFSGVDYTFTGTVTADRQFRLTRDSALKDQLERHRAALGPVADDWQALLVSDGQLVLKYDRPVGLAVIGPAGARRGPNAEYFYAKRITEWLATPNAIQDDLGVRTVDAGEHLAVAAGPPAEGVTTIVQEPGQYSTFRIYHDVDTASGIAIKSRFVDPGTGALARLVEASDVAELAADLWRPRSYRDTRYIVRPREGSYAAVLDAAGQPVVDYYWDVQVSAVTGANVPLERAMFDTEPPAEAEQVTRFTADGEIAESRSKRAAELRVGTDGARSIREALDMPLTPTSTTNPAPAPATMPKGQESGTGAADDAPDSAVAPMVLALGVACAGGAVTFLARRRHAASVAVRQANGTSGNG
ncbi:MAG TPA: hypothetical protein VK324_09170 [Tepidisphaeraceae bacterium]|nr:hypothetical protein [Tepidisphaeraceae bacterium]